MISESLSKYQNKNTVLPEKKPSEIEKQSKVNFDDKKEKQTDVKIDIEPKGSTSRRFTDHSVESSFRAVESSATVEIGDSAHTSMHRHSSHNQNLHHHIPTKISPGIKNNTSKPPTPKLDTVLSASDHSKILSLNIIDFPAIKVDPNATSPNNANNSSIHTSIKASNNNSSSQYTQSSHQNQDQNQNQLLLPTHNNNSKNNNNDQPQRPGSSIYRKKKEKKIFSSKLKKEELVLVNHPNENRIEISQEILAQNE
jgi:hypothetical protein